MNHSRLGRCRWERSSNDGACAGRSGMPMYLTTVSARAAPRIDSWLAPPGFLPRATRPRLMMSWVALWSAAAVDLSRLAGWQCPVGLTVSRYAWPLLPALIPSQPAIRSAEKCCRAMTIGEQDTPRARCHQVDRTRSAACQRQRLRQMCFRVHTMALSPWNARQRCHQLAPRRCRHRYRRRSCRCS